MRNRCFSKGIGQVGPVAALLIATILPLAYCSKILSFSTDVQVTSHVFVTGQDVNVTCQTDGSSSVQIKRLSDGVSLNISTGREQSLTYQIRPVTCEDMGMYECVVDTTKRQTTEVIVSDCPPQPCQGDDFNITKFVDVNQTVQLSMCVLVYPDIFENVQFNNISVRKKALPNMTCWTWDYQEIKTSYRLIKTLNISISCDQMASEEYGRLKVRFYSKTGTSFYLNYTIWLRAPGPPDCPSEVNVANNRLNNVSLSWKPGLDGGVNQSFHVYYTKDNVTWYEHAITNSTFMNTITGLEADTDVSFRVVSSNMYRTDVNETICENTVHAKIEKVIKDTSTDSPDSSFLPTIILISVAIIILLLIVVLGVWFIKLRKRRQTRHGDKGHQRKHNSRHLTMAKGRQLESGDYTSQEGLKYITVYQVRDMFKKKKFKDKRKRKKESKIVYADLDFLKTGKSQGLMRVVEQEDS